MLKFHSEDKDPQVKLGLQQQMAESLTRGVGFRVWNVEPNEIEYQYDKGHTLSLYLDGGQETFRCDQPHLKGQSGKLCLMPQGHFSRWCSPKPIRIAHLYLPDQFLRQEAERHLNLDARLLNLRDLVYQTDEGLSGTMLSLIQRLKNANRIEPLYAEQSLHTVTALLLERYSDKSGVFQASCHHRPF